MAYGLQVFNSSGNLILDYTSRVSRFVLSGTTSTLSENNGYVDITVPNMTNTDTWIVAVAESVLADSTYQSMIYLRYTVQKNSGNFRITNTSASNGSNSGKCDASFNYWVFKS